MSTWEIWARGLALVEGAGLAGGPWQPIETAPKDGTWVLASCGGRHPVVVQWSDRANDSMNWNDTEYTYPALAWMPLPAPPVAEAPHA